MAIHKHKSGKQWVIIAYDVRDPRRLRQVHYFLKKQATALQKSVFMLSATQKQITGVLSGIKSRVDGRVDDVRLYPIRYPGDIWSAGQQDMALKGLYSAGPKKTPQKGMKRFIKRIFRREKS